MNSYDMLTREGCVAFIVDRRIMCRRFCLLLDGVGDENRRDMRQARKYLDSKNPILTRRAETIEVEVKRRNEVARECREQMIAYGRELFDFSSYIDTSVPQSLLLDLLNVNLADRCKVSPSDGFLEIVQIKSLEDSAMYRGAYGWKQGPLTQAMTRFASHEMLHNERIKQAMHEHLFGIGGMFEFLPTYSRMPDGEFVRNPPKLREACDADIA